MFELWFLTGWDSATFWDKILEQARDRKEKRVKKLQFFEFFDILLSRDVSPGIFAATLVPDNGNVGQRFLLSRDKWTAVQGNFFVPGLRDNGTSRPLETLV